jgi:hypothetical protein
LDLSEHARIVSLSLVFFQSELLHLDQLEDKRASLEFGKAEVQPCHTDVLLNETLCPTLNIKTLFGFIRHFGSTLVRARETTSFKGDEKLFSILQSVGNWISIGFITVTCS